MSECILHLMVMTVNCKQASFFPVIRYALLLATHFLDIKNHDCDPFDTVEYVTVAKWKLNHLLFQLPAIESLADLSENIIDSPTSLWHDKSRLFQKYLSSTVHALFSLWFFFYHVHDLYLNAIFRSSPDTH